MTSELDDVLKILEIGETISSKGYGVKFLSEATRP